MLCAIDLGGRVAALDAGRALAFTGGQKSWSSFCSREIAERPNRCGLGCGIYPRARLVLLSSVLGSRAHNLKKVVLGSGDRLLGLTRRTGIPWRECVGFRDVYSETK